MAIACVKLLFNTSLLSPQESPLRSRPLLHPDIALWFAVQVAPQHEQKVSALLQYKGQEQFLPTSKSQRHWSDRTKLLQRPLFPGYLFCRATRSSFAAILNTPGVYRLVCFGGRPYPIPDFEIDALRQLAASGRDISDVSYLSIGQKVQVSAGPLAGLNGIITRLKNRDRLIVSIEIIMRSVSVEITSSDIVALSPVT